jgi:hypothetical protein
MLQLDFLAPPVIIIRNHWAPWLWHVQDAQGLSIGPTGRLDDLVVFAENLGLEYEIMLSRLNRLR